MDTTEILSLFVRGALGSRGRKRARRAANFLGGKRGFLTASTLIGAAGLAWGIYDSVKGQGANSATGAGAMGAVPPIPGAAAAPVPMPSEVLRVVRLAVSAARADGSLAAQEREIILQHARAAGIEATVEQELASARPLADIVIGLTDAQRKQDLYVLAFTIIRADESVSGAERIYLAQLAHQLGLDAATTARLEQETAAKIDSSADTEP